MTEFNAQEIIDFLKQKLKNVFYGRHDLIMMTDGEKSKLREKALTEFTEDVRKVLRLQIEIEKSGYNKPSCSWCKKLPFDEYGDRDLCTFTDECFPVKENRLKHFEWRYTLEDFK